MGKQSGSGSGMNNPDHISESLETIFWFKILKSLMRIRDPEWIKFVSGINIPDPHKIVVVQDQLTTPLLRWILA
jgi:hypothetical protein